MNQCVEGGLAHSSVFRDFLGGLVSLVPNTWTPARGGLNKYMYLTLPLTEVNHISLSFCNTFYFSEKSRKPPNNPTACLKERAQQPKSPKVDGRKPSKFSPAALKLKENIFFSRLQRWIWRKTVKKFACGAEMEEKIIRNFACGTEGEEKLSKFSSAALKLKGNRQNFRLRRWS